MNRALKKICFAVASALLLVSYNMPSWAQVTPPKFFVVREGKCLFQGPCTWIIHCGTDDRGLAQDVASYLRLSGLNESHVIPLPAAEAQFAAGILFSDPYNATKACVVG